MKVLDKIYPQPPPGIKYMLGGETWMKPEARTPVRLECEEWGNLGPMELNPKIKKNKAGFRVRSTTIIAPSGAMGFTKIDGIYYWTDTDVWGRDSSQREQESSALGQGQSLLPPPLPPLRNPHGE